MIKHKQGLCHVYSKSAILLLIIIWLSHGLTDQFTLRDSCKNLASNLCVQSESATSPTIANNFHFQKCWSVICFWLLTLLQIRYIAAMYTYTFVLRPWVCIWKYNRLKQAVREAATICLRPATPHVAAQHVLLPVAVGAMNIHDVRDRQTSDSDRHASSLNASALPKRRHNN